MKSIDQIERLLGQTPAPSCSGGAAPGTTQTAVAGIIAIRTAKERTHEDFRYSSRMSSMMKLAAGFTVGGRVLIGTGWAAEKIYKRIRPW